MEAANLKKRLKQHISVNHLRLQEATNYYIKAFGAVKKKCFLFPHIVELVVGDTTLVITESINNLPPREPQIKLEVIADNVDELRTLALMPANAIDLPVSDDERDRGIVSKIIDPYGYIWLLSQTEASGICKLCYCSSPLHVVDSLCLHPRTLTWIKQVSHTPSSVKELGFSTKLEEKYKKFIQTCNDHVENRSVKFENDPYHGFTSLMEYMINVYRYMIIIRWSHLIIRFCTKEIEREFEDACERLDRILLRVHSRLECVNLDLVNVPLELWKLGVESILKLLQKIRVKVGFTEEINEEIVHWNSLLG